MDSVVNASNFDSFLQNRYLGDTGFFKCRDIPLTEFILDTPAAMAGTGAGVVGWGSISTTMRGLVWDDTADGSDIIRWMGTLPTDYRRSDETTDSKQTIILRAYMRKLDGTGSATDNTDLAVIATPYWHSPSYSTAGVAADGDTSIKTVNTAITKTLGTKAAATAEEAFRWYEFDLLATANFTSATVAAAARQALKPQSSFQFTLKPNETVGTDLYIELLACELWYPALMTAKDQYDRRKIRISS